VKSSLGHRKVSRYPISSYAGSEGQPSFQGKEPRWNTSHLGAWWHINRGRGA